MHFCNGLISLLQDLGSFNAFLKIGRLPEQLMIFVPVLALGIDFAKKKKKKIASPPISFGVIALLAFRLHIG